MRTFIHRLALGILGMGCGGAAAAAGTTHRVSLDPLGKDANGPSFGAAVADHEKYVAFTSGASNLTNEMDKNEAFDVFIRVADTVYRVSKNYDGGDANGPSMYPALSDQGRYVAFVSHATNLVKKDTNGVEDVFVHDRETTSTERVSVRSDGQQSPDGSFGASISGDGARVAFVSLAALVPEDTNGLPDVYVRDRVLGTTARVSVGDGGVQGDGHTMFAAISADGRFVAFQSTSTNLVADDDNGVSDVFVRDLVSQTTERSSVDSKETELKKASLFPSISGTGRFVVFESGGATTQVYVRDRAKGKTKLVSRTKKGDPGNGDSGAAKISRDGNHIAFRTLASNLVKHDANGNSDVVRCKRSGKQMRLVSVDVEGFASNGSSDFPAIDADGSHVFFQSDAFDLTQGDGNAAQDLFVRDP